LDEKFSDLTFAVMTSQLSKNNEEKVAKIASVTFHAHRVIDWQNYMDQAGIRNFQSKLMMYDPVSFTIF